MEVTIVAVVSNTQEESAIKVRTTLLLLVHTIILFQTGVIVEIPPEIRKVVVTTDESPPSDVLPPSYFSAKLYSEVNLTCSYIGNPAPTGTWHKDNVAIPNSETIQNVEDTILNIGELNLTHRGYYNCSAHNRLGSDFTNTFILNITGNVQKDGHAIHFCESI